MAQSFSLFQISYTAPWNISLPVFDFWMNLTFHNQTSSSVARMGNTDTGDWAFLWFIESDTPPILNHLHDQIREQSTTFTPTITLDLGSIFLSITPVADKNWLAECYRTIPPFMVGSFFIRGSHDRDVPVPSGHIGLVIDAATAFGSGEHSTTRGCLTSLLALQAKGFVPGRILDLGTGSGILAIAARKLWKDATILAVDNDPESVKIATEYATLNNASIMVISADTPAAPNVTMHGPFDLVIANILAGPLRILAPAIVGALAPTGNLILSGLLDSQIEDVAAAYIPFGWIVHDQIIATDDWVALTLSKK